MKLSRGLWQTYKEVPADAEIPSHQLMLRSGLIHKSGSGLYTYLPFALKSIRKIENLIREELDKIGCQELLMSVVTPSELWKESGRWDAMGDEMLTLKDKAGRELCISPTNEESVVDIFRKNIKSYKQLPQNLYQINTKFRDEIRPRFGLMRAREFTMKDAYSFHMDKACMDQEYERMYKAYENILSRMGLEFRVVEADGGAMASPDSKTHEFQVVADTGEDEIIYAKDTAYAANIEKAQTKRIDLSMNTGKGVIQEIETKNKQTIEDVSLFLEIPKHQCLKSLVYKYIIEEDEKFCLLQLLGDDDLNELKLKSILKADQIILATDNELLKLGFVKGYIGPYKNNVNIDIIFDNSVEENALYTIGANKENYHLTGFNPSRDFEGEFKKNDLRLSCAGDMTLDGKSKVQIRRGIEVGHIFQLGDKYTRSMGATVLDNNGKAKSPLMGCYGLGVSRILAACVEQNFDENGIIWPKNIAPYLVHFIVVAKADETKQLAEDIYSNLQNNKIDTVFDDRKAGAGFKFKDADLLGLPVQVVLGERDFQKDGMLEIRIRKTGEKMKVTPEELLSKISDVLEGL